jgi:hypothetical protein
VRDYISLTSRALASIHRAARRFTMKHSIVLALAVCACTAPARVSPQTPNQSVPELAARRAQMIQWLHEYREAGIYPSDAAGMPASVFRDANGVRCPMAELIHKSGRDDLVDAVATQANALRLADVHSGPLYDWMTHSGLTLQEIAMVQGAMNIDMGPLEYIPQNREIIMASALGQVRGHLDTAEVALRDGTAAGLTALAALAPSEKTKGPIVPAQLAAAAQSQHVVLAPQRSRAGAWIVRVRN